MEGLAQLMASLQASGPGAAPFSGFGGFAGKGSSSGGSGSSSNRGEAEAFIKSFMQQLDELAQTDPQSYDDFVRGQAEANGLKVPKGMFARAAGAETPLPSLVITAATRPPPGALPAPGAPRNARICIWKAAPGAMPPATVGHRQRIGPGTADWGGFELQVREKCAPTPAKHPTGAPIIVYEVEANAEAVASAARNSPPALRALVVEKALRAVEGKHGVRLERAGLAIVVAKAEADEEERTAAEAQQRAAAVEHAAQGTAAQQLPASLLQQLAGVSGSLQPSTVASKAPAASTKKGQSGALQSQGSSCSTSGGGSPSVSAAKGAAGRRPLIEELPSKLVDMPLQQQHRHEQQAVQAQAGMQIQQQQQDCSPSNHLYQVTHVTHRGVPSLRVTVPDLPITSASEADLQAVDPTLLRLTLQLTAVNTAADNGVQCLDGPWACGSHDLRLPEAVDMDRVRARFDAKQRQLVLTLPLLTSDA